MRLTLVFLFAIFTFSASYGQYYKSGTLTLTSKLEVKGKFLIQTKNQTVSAKNNTSYTFNQVESLLINNRNYSKELVNGTAYLGHELVSGKARLIQIESNKYLIQKEDGTYKEIDLENESNLVRGILSVLFEDCNAIRDRINSNNKFSEKDLISITTSYNSCSYSDFSPTESEINSANSFNTDAFKFYLGFGMDIKNINFLDNFYDEDLNQFGFKLGLLTSPGFLGKTQGNLYFNFDASFIFGAENTFVFIDNDVQYSVNSYRILMGLNYFFNKTGKINPFIGINGGTNWDRFNGDVNDESFDLKSHNLIWAPKAGILFSLKNEKELGFSIDYIPEYSNDLFIPINDEPVNIDLSSSSFSFSLSYYF